jgi:hypothetical protein
MKTYIDFKKLATMPDVEARKALAAAVRYEFEKPMLAYELAKMAAITKKGNLKGAGFSANDPSFDRIKSFLATKYATPSDNPILTGLASDFEQFFHTNMPEIDMAFDVLFDLVDLRASIHSQFEITDTNAGITWLPRKPGEITKLRRNISESQTTVPYVEYSDGIGILDVWLQFQKWWNIDEAINEFRAKYYDKMASMHYGLFTALGAGINTAFATDDAQTANNAAGTIIRACKTKGYAVGDNPTFYAVCAIEKVGRLEKMLTAQRGSAIVDAGTVSQPLAHRIAGIIGTTNVAAADTGWYLVLPGRKIKRGIWKDLTVESDRDIEVSATNMVGVGQFNAAIGDSAQVARCLYV